MINLIPAVAKRRVLQEYWFRTGTLWLGLVSILIIILVILLIPVYVLIYSQTNEYKLAAQQATLEVERYDVSAAALIQASQRARLLLSATEQLKFSDVIKIIEGVSRNGISLTSYEITRTEGKISPLQITGRAESRQELSEFRAGLLTEPSIDTVVLPISNLARDRDIVFSITVTLKENN